MRYMLAGALAAAILGAFALYMAASRPSHVDSSGLLHEPFAWMASGRILLLFSAIMLTVSALRWALQSLKQQRQF